LREKELQGLISERKKLFTRCLTIEELGNKISSVLTTFSTKITKIKSDSDLFEERVKK
jgi:hypothetical protein